MAYSSDEHIIPISFYNVIGTNESGEKYQNMYGITKETWEEVCDVFGDSWKVETRTNVVIDCGSASSEKLFIFPTIHFITNDDTDTLFTLVNDRYVGSNNGNVLYMLNKTTTDREQRALHNTAMRTFIVMNPSYYTKFISVRNNSNDMAESILFIKMIDRYDGMKKKWYLEVGSSFQDAFYDMDRQAMLQSPIFPPASVDTRINGESNFLALAPNVIVTDTEEIESVNTFIAVYDITSSNATRSIMLGGKEFVHIQCYRNNRLGRANNYVRIGDKE